MARKLASSNSEPSGDRKGVVSTAFQSLPNKPLSHGCGSASRSARSKLIAFLAGLVACTAPAQTPERVLFDTDSGFFGDDGAALVMLLRSPRKVTLEAITVVPGNVWPLQGAEYMFHILEVLKQHRVPLYLGARAPLVHSAAMAEVEHATWGPIEFRGAFERPEPKSQKDLDPPLGGKFTGRVAGKRNAMEVLIDIIERYPGQITVLELGPMTNLAMAIRLKPDIETKIRRLVFMGGNVRVPGNSTPAAEFNFWFDPEAAAIVLRSCIREKVMFGLDICNRAKITKDRFDQIVRERTPITDLFREDMGNRYPGFFKRPDATGYLWDTLAAAYLLDPGFVSASGEMYLDVDTRFGKTYGQPAPLDRKLAPHATPVRVMFDLDFPRVFALFKNLLTRRQ